MGWTDERIATLNQLAAAGDEKGLALIQALSDDAVKVQGEQVLIVADDGSTTDAITGAAVAANDEAQDAIVNNRMRSALETAMAVRNLFGTDVGAQRDAATLLQRAAFDEPDDSQIPLIEKALAGALDDQARDSLDLALAAMQLAAEDDAKRLSAAKALGEKSRPALRPLLLQRLEAEANPAVKAALSAALSAIDRQLVLGSALSQAFTGISLGSILLLAALGLAITYGLMGVINMAHGELMMIGAYATYVMQGVFQRYFPGAFDWYLVAAVPVAFMASALMGAVLERSVIRFLYGRPLETLLATWGISLMLQQLVRTVFGAQNVGVENPAWMSGGVQVLPGVLGGQKIKLWDTAGIRRKSRVVGKIEKLAVSDALRAIRFAETVVIIFDATIPFEKQDLQIARLVIDEGRALVIVVNKWDLIEPKG